MAINEQVLFMQVILGVYLLAYYGRSSSVSLWFLSGMEEEDDMLAQIIFVRLFLNNGGNHNFVHKNCKHP